MISQRQMDQGPEERLLAVAEWVAEGQVAFGRKAGTTFRVSMWDVSMDELLNLQKGYPLVLIISKDEVLITTESELGIGVDFSKRKVN
jgi:hypothetical protein